MCIRDSLNTTLTVPAHRANGHKNIGWSWFTDGLIRLLCHSQPYLICVLWGAFAQKKRSLVPSHHTIISSPHPSPLSAHRGFFGSRPFSLINKALSDHGDTPINWGNR